MAAKGVRLDATDSAILKRWLRDIDPANRRGVVAHAMKSVVFAGVRDAKEKRIIRGRGNAAPLPKELTRRSGFLIQSISGDLSQAPKRWSMGSPAEYAAVHETGKRVAVPPHTRTSKKGKSFKVKGYSIKFPKRPYLRPAAEYVMRVKARDFFRIALKRAQLR